MASTRLTNADRDTAVSNALKATFNERIEQQKANLTEYAKRVLAEKHPVFMEMKKDPERRAYMSIHQNLKFQVVETCLDPAGKKRTSYIVLRAPNTFSYTAGGQSGLRQEGWYRPDGWAFITAPLDHPRILAKSVLSQTTPWPSSTSPFGANTLTLRTRCAKRSTAIPRARSSRRTSPTSPNFCQLAGLRCAPSRCRSPACAPS